MNSTHICSFGAKINDAGVGVTELGVLSHFRNSNSDKMLITHALFCARPNRIPETDIKDFINIP
jgi:hypothetical protein